MPRKVSSKKEETNSIVEDSSSTFSAPLSLGATMYTASVALLVLSGFVLIFAIVFFAKDIYGRISVSDYATCSKSSAAQMVFNDPGMCLSVDGRIFIEPRGDRKIATTDIVKRKYIECVMSSGRSIEKNYPYGCTTSEGERYPRPYSPK